MEERKVATVLFADLAAFGAPAAYEDRTERALHTALSMQRRLDALFDGRLQLRIGVNTGEVVVGRAREGSSFVSGDSVNVAARLEQATAPGEILVGERTVAASRGARRVDRGPCRMRGASPRAVGGGANHLTRSRGGDQRPAAPPGRIAGRGGDRA